MIFGIAQQTFDVAQPGEEPGGQHTGKVDGMGAGFAATGRQALFPNDSLSDCASVTQKRLPMRVAPAGHER